MFFIIYVFMYINECSYEFFIRSSQVYYMFGFLFLVFVILVITCSETTILLCYFHLCAEVSIACVGARACIYMYVYVNFMIRYPLQDYHWWWRSFLTSGFTAVYLLIYCIHFFITKLEIEGATSTFLYFGYTLIMVYLFFLLTGKYCVCFKYCYY
jgi:transmembrane 9 superfamily protein 2/4